MEPQAYTYRKDLYYINYDLGRGVHREIVVGRLRFWLTYLVNFWRWRRWQNVIRERGEWN